MLASSHNSSQSHSTMSHNSGSPLHSSGPLTPPESAPNNLPGTPRTPASPRRSPRAIRKLSRSTTYSYPQPISFESHAHVHAHSSPQTMSPANLMPPPSSTYPMGSSFGSAHSPMMGSPMGYAPGSQFQPYGHAYPTNSYFPSQAPMMAYSYSQQSSHSSRPMQSDTEAEGEEDFDLAASMVDLDGEGTTDPNRPSTTVSMLDTPGPSSSATATLEAKPPRPPNAWIIYRSDMLKSISAGRCIPGLEDVMREAGYPVASSGTGSSAEESGMDVTQSATDDDGKPAAKPKKRAKGKKGAKEPTEGLLSLGRGKTGRGLPQAHISKMISTLWKRESQDVRAKYEKMSEAKKLEHSEKYPDYKFQPMRRADKMRIKELSARERKVEKEASKIEKEIQKAATRNASRKSPGTRTRTRPSTSPYSPYTFEPKQSLSRSVSTQALQHGGPSKSRKGKASEPNITEWKSMYEQAPFPFPIDQPHLQAGPLQYPQTPYETPSGPSSSSDPSRNHTRQSSPSKPIPIAHTPMQYDQAYMMPPPPPPPPAHMPMQASPIIDPSLYTPAHTPAETPASYPPPQPYMPPQGFYYDVSGLGTPYAQPVVFEPQSLPESIGLEDLYQDFGTDDPTQLIEQWVEFIPEEDNAVASGSGDVAPETEGVQMDASWLQDPNAAADAWGDLSVESQEQFFHDLDLSHAMAVQLVPELDMSLISPYPMDGSYMPDPLHPMVDYDAGYLSMPYYTTEEVAPTPPPNGSANLSESGPFLSVQQPMSPDPNATTPRQSTFAHNAINTTNTGQSLNTTPSIDAGSVFDQAPAPRFVSASAFPDTPLSVDPSGLGGLDRRISYANAGLDWCDDNANEAQAQGNDQDSVKLEHPSPVKLDIPTSPSPHSQSRSNASSPTKSPHPPRGARRARSVAAAF